MRKNSKREAGKSLLLAALSAAGLLFLATGAKPAMAKTETAIFAGGCFWCVESDFDQVTGVLETTSGYTGGTTENPTYRQVGKGGTGHIEAVQIKFDNSKVSYKKLLAIFFRSVDPTDAGGQFCDRGETYQTAIFARDRSQLLAAQEVKKAIQAAKFLSKPVVTPIRMATPFYPAEGYHQNYYKKNPIRYKFYRFNCGRDARIRKIWKDQAHRGITKH